MKQRNISNNKEDKDMKKTIIIIISFILGVLLGLIIMFGLFMNEHEEIHTEGIQLETTEYYPNGTDSKTCIYGTHEDCVSYFEKLGVKNWVSSKGEGGYWVCYYSAADLKKNR